MSRKFVLAFTMTLFLLGTLRAHGSALDAGLYSSYNTSGDRTEVYFTVCGSIGTGRGCYGGGTLGPVGRAGILVEGSPTQNTKLGTVTRFIYLLDMANGASGQGVALCIYKRVDTINPDTSYDTVTLSSFKLLPFRFRAVPTLLPSWLRMQSTFLSERTRTD
jgi:hypothetical protein